MRRLLAALTVLSLAGAAPAHADPAVHVVIIAGAPTDVTVTCDVSSYPAARYPCAYDLTVQDGCLDVTAASGCTLSARSTIHAIPGDSPSENCAFSADPGFVLTFDAPGYHVDWKLGTITTVPRTGVVFNYLNTYTAWETIFWTIPINNTQTLELGEPTGVLTAGFTFDDLAWDCRRNDGGNPTSSGAGIDPNPFVNSSAVNPNPAGAFTFTRV